MTGQADSHASQNLAASAAVSAVVALLAFVLAAMAQNDWVFEYPLDDVYIHLSMAAEIRHGGYGVNADEWASAASSPLYPVLLTPFAETPSQRWWPLLWNIAALVIAARLVGQALDKAQLGRAGFWLAIAAPACLAMYATAYAGMENMAHTAASLAIVLGLWRFAETGRITALLIAGVLFAPAFRLEGLALTTAAGAAVLVLGRPIAGMGLIALGAVPALAFVWFLTSLGLDPLPNSVMAKLSDQAGADEGGFLARVAGTFSANANTYGGRYLLALAMVTTLVSLAAMKTNRGKAYVGLAVSVSAFAHLAFGSMGWLDRYENYAIVALFVALTMVLSGSALVRVGVLAVALVGGLLTYGPYVPNNMTNMAAIYRQHAQMARFAKEFAQTPVAVNDLGYIAWHNPNYVLDLWGLASKEALNYRLSETDMAWADALADAHGVRFAMIYDKWAGEALGPTWVKLGTLSVYAPGAFLGGPDVAFYARRATYAPVLSDQLEAWSKGLPRGAHFIFAGEARE